MARDFKGNDKGRDDLFAATPPLEAERMLLSSAATIAVAVLGSYCLYMQRRHT